VRKTLSEPSITNAGIAFMVEVDCVKHECLVSKNALAYLQRMQGEQTDFLDIYHAHQDKIHNISRRLITAGVKESPLVLGAAYFV